MVNGVPITTSGCIPSIVGRETPKIRVHATRTIALVSLPNRLEMMRIEACATSFLLLQERDEHWLLPAKLLGRPEFSCAWRSV